MYILRDPVEKYGILLNHFSFSEKKDRAIVRKVRRMESDRKAFVFFQKFIDPPEMNDFLLGSSRSVKRETIINLQKYLREIGMKVPKPNKSVQRFLDGGKYPTRKA